MKDATACGIYKEIITNFKLTDEQSARDLRAIASDTINPELAAAIKETADAFARHDEVIPSDPVLSLCP